MLCPHGHGPLRRYSPDQAAEALAAGEAGERFLLVARVARPKRGADDALGELIRQGFIRRLGRGKNDAGEVVRMEPGERWPKVADPLPLVLGRFTAGGDGGGRLAETVEEGYRLGAGAVEAVEAGPAHRPTGEAPRTRTFSRSLVLLRLRPHLARPHARPLLVQLARSVRAPSARASAA